MPAGQISCQRTCWGGWGVGSAPPSKGLPVTMTAPKVLRTGFRKLSSWVMSGACLPSRLQTSPQLRSPLNVPRTGKTSLVQQLVRQRFTSQYRATIGADFDVKEVRCGEQNVSLQIWDSPGDDRYCDIGKSFWRGAHMCLLVYDITNQASFQNLGHWVGKSTNWVQLWWRR